MNLCNVLLNHLSPVTHKWALQTRRHRGYTPSLSIVVIRSDGIKESKSASRIPRGSSWATWWPRIWKRRKVRAKWNHTESQTKGKSQWSLSTVCVSAIKLNKQTPLMWWQGYIFPKFSQKKKKSIISLITYIPPSKTTHYNIIFIVSDTQFNWDYTGVLVKKATRQYTPSLWVKLGNYDEPVDLTICQFILYFCLNPAFLIY